MRFFETYAPPVVGLPAGARCRALTRAPAQNFFYLYTSQKSAL